MNVKWQEQYERLRRDLNLLSGTGLDGVALTELWFKCALQHWDELKALVLRNGFNDEQEEIRFFKFIKPQFTGRMEYYTLLYNYQLFHPAGDIVEWSIYIQREQKKIDRFKAAHEDFVQYYTSGRKDKDAIFFLRRYYDGEPRTYVRVYDQDPALFTAYDWILTIFVGNGLFEQFLQNENGTLIGNTGGN